MKMNITRRILAKILALIAIICIFSFSFLYYDFNLKIAKKTDLTKSEISEICEIIGIEHIENLDIISFEVRKHLGDGYNVIKMPKKNKSDILKTNVAESCDELCGTNFFNKNSKLYPYDCLYCRMFYDNDCIYLSFRNHAYGKGTELMDYFYEIYPD